MAATTVSASGNFSLRGGPLLKPSQIKWSPANMYTQRQIIHYATMHSAAVRTVQCNVEAAAFADGAGDVGVFELLL